MVSAGYRSTFATAQQAWCELLLTESDFELLKGMQYDSQLHPQLMSGSGMLFSLLDAQLYPNTDRYVGSVYDPASPSFLLQGGCPIKPHS